jgi:arsenate reductase
MGERGRISVLFLCRGNSCRSQMAEGFARALRGDRIEAFSAGSEAHGLNPMAVKVMAEEGIDISGQRSKTTDELEGRSFDYAVTVCGTKGETCPFYANVGASVHRGFPDPPKLAEDAADEEEALGLFRQVRDMIRDYVETLPESLERSDDGGPGISPTALQ